VKLAHHYSNALLKPYLKMNYPKANQQSLIDAMSDSSISSQVKEILNVKLEDAKHEVEHNKRMRQLQELKLQMELRALFNNITGSSSAGPPLQLGHQLQRANSVNQSPATVERLPSRPPSPNPRKQAEATQLTQALNRLQQQQQQQQQQQ
jgi:hypothetical protein